MTSYPAQTTQGKVVRVVSKRQEGTETILTDKDGNEYVAAKRGLNIIPRQLAEEAARADLPPAAAAIVAPSEPHPEAELKTEAELEAEAEGLGTGDPMDEGGPLDLGTGVEEQEADAPAPDETPAAEAAPEGGSENGEEADTTA